MWHFDGWNDICTTNTPTCDVNMESLLKVMESVKRLPKPEFDCVVCLRGTFDSIPKAEKEEIGGMFGMEVYQCESVFEMVDVGKKLRANGRRPAALSPEGIVSDLLEAVGHEDR